MQLGGIIKRLTILETHLNDFEELYEEKFLFQVGLIPEELWDPLEFQIQIFPVLYFFFHYY